VVTPEQALELFDRLNLKLAEEYFRMVDELKAVKLELYERARALDQKCHDCKEGDCYGFAGMQDSDWEYVRNGGLAYWERVPDSGDE
jgi:hypothetical protein